jgi:hypothetical protein
MYAIIELLRVTQSCRRMNASGRAEAPRMPVMKIKALESSIPEQVVSMEPDYYVMPGDSS